MLQDTHKMENQLLEADDFLVLIEPSDHNESDIEN